MMKSMPGRLVLSIFTSLLLVSSFAYSQTAQLDSLRVSSGESARAKCDLCYWFTKYEMADSAFACLESLRSDALSEDLELYALLVEANANLIT